MRNMRFNNNDILFYFIPLFFLISLFLNWNIKEFVTPDSLSYIRNAAELPYITSIVYPIFYSLILKIFNLFFSNYLLTYKVVSITSILFCFFFVKQKDFFWREIWCMLSFTSFFKLYPYAWSEIAMVPLFIVFFYLNYKLIAENKIKDRNYIILNSFILCAMVMTKSSSLFVVMAFALFSVVLFIYNKGILKTYLVSLFFALLLIATYFFYNKFMTGEFIVKRLPANYGGKTYIRISLSNTIFNLNPFFHGRGKFLNLFTFGYNISYLFGGFFAVVWIYFILKFLINKTNKNKLMLIFCLICSFVFLVLSIISYLTYKIDPLDFRLLLGYYIMFFFAVILSVKNFGIRKNYILLAISSISILQNIIVIIFPLN